MECLFHGCFFVAQNVLTVCASHADMLRPVVSYVGCGGGL